MQMYIFAVEGGLMLISCTGAAGLCHYLEYADVHNTLQ